MPPVGNAPMLKQRALRMLARSSLLVVIFGELQHATVAL
jgi:hypothetical protein